MKAATFAFVTSDGGNNLSAAVQENIQDMTDFVKLGGNLIISCGGASSPWIESTMSVDRMVTVLTDLFTKTGAKGIDLDVEGTALHNTGDIDKLNKAVSQLQKKLGLYVSYTIPVGDPKWESISDLSQGLLNNAKLNGVNVSVVNMMLMDLYGDYTTRPRWGNLAIEIAENAKKTLMKIFPDKNETSIYRMMGLCPMIGVQDDNSIFNVEDAKILARYAKEKSVGLYTFWAMQRDQIGNVDLNLHSKVNKVDFEFYNAVKSILGSTTPVPVPTPTPVPVPTPKPVPVPTPLVGQVILGNTIVQDNKPDWVKIDNVTVGDTFEYTSYKSTDVGKLLDTVMLDSKIQVLLYKWDTGEAYSKTGYNFTNQSDTKLNPGFTSFIKKVKNNVPVVPTPAPNPTPMNSSFVSWNGNQFMLNNQPFVPVGVNCFGLGLCQEYMNYFSHKQITEVFESTKKMSGTCIRSHTLGFSASSENSLLDYNLNFREAAWDPIDFSLSEAKRTGIKVIPIFSDPYEYYHGSYKAFCTNGVPKEQFFTHPTPRANFKKYISGWLNHKNKYTGIINKDCPDIFALQLCNECGQQRPSAGSTAIPSKEWLTDISNHIKSIAPNILVLCPTDESLGQSDEFNIKNLDVYSQHFYWNDFNRMNINYNNAKKVNKPYIIGEYSSQFGQDWFSYIEKLGVHGSFSWSLYPHESDGKRVPHDDGFTFWLDNYTPENKKQLLLMTNHFRRLQGKTQITELIF
jgi:mannan endo-1,4-beta-mannosidase